jgi:predicted peptidase
MNPYIASCGLAFCMAVNAYGAIPIEPGTQMSRSLCIQADSSDGRDIKIPYLLFVPQQYSRSREPMPLLLFLHGLGECGNGTNLELVKTHGPPKIVEHRRDFPFVVVSPQCPPPGGKEGVPNAWKPGQLIRLVDHVATNLRIDQRRIYVTGLSMGGYGAWRFAATYPGRVAAVVPICGGGEPKWMATPLARVPIWAFHGERDPVVPLARSHEMVRAICQRGGQVRFTVYPEAKHDSWTKTYDNEQVYDWLLSHKGPKP